MAHKTTCPKCGNEMFHCDGNVHLWFELSYCSYMILPRSILQSMPEEWQEKFVKMVEELWHRYEGIHPNQATYMVRLRNGNGQFIKDELAHYDRGRRHVEPTCKGAGNVE